MKYHLLFSFLLLPFWGKAQVNVLPSVQICLEQNNNELEIRLIPDGNFQGVVSNIQFTLECSDSNTSFGNILQTPLQAAYMSVQKAGNDTIIGTNKYQTYVVRGLVSMSDASINQTWQANTPVVLMKLQPSSFAGAFAIYNPYTPAMNRASYVELNGVQRATTISCIIGSLNPSINLFAKWAGNDANLTWEKTEQVEYQSYFLERADKGEEFKKVGETDGQTFHFLDKSVRLTHEDYVRYRLTAVDIDGKMETTDPVTLNISEMLQIIAYPNPVEEAIFLQFTGIEEASVKICDVNGKIYYEQAREITGNLLKISTQNWASGVYYLAVQGGNQQESFKFVKR
ncbi:MAG: T9SS type A sorting domain-containing protein [Bacteroidia bacterium]